MTDQPRPFRQPAQPYGEAGPQHYGDPDPRPYGEAEPQPYGEPAPATPQNSKLSIISLVLSGLALLILPFLLGPAAIVLAAMGRRRCEPLSRVAFPVAVAATVIGVLITFVLLAAMD